MSGSEPMRSCQCASEDTGVPALMDACLGGNTLNLCMGARRGTRPADHRDEINKFLDRTGTSPQRRALRALLEKLGP